MNGKCGWFPEAYVEKVEESSQLEITVSDVSTGITTSEDSSFMAVQGKVPTASPTPGQVRYCCLKLHGVVNTKKI